MPSERFPKGKYLRMLVAMERELDDWYVGYRHAAAAHPDDWIGSRFEARAAVIDDARRLALELRDTLYHLPRLS